LYTTISSLISTESFRPSQEKVEVPTHLIPEGTGSGNLFAVKISGDFMTDAGVLNGDCLIITETGKATNGNIVLAVVHGKEIALRRWSEEGDKIFLTAANKYFMPQVYDKDKVKIKGRLVGLFRQY
jgi:repressor LexA